MFESQPAKNMTKSYAITAFAIVLFLFLLPLPTSAVKGRVVKVTDEGLAANAEALTSSRQFIKWKADKDESNTGIKRNCFDIHDKPGSCSNRKKGRLVANPSVINNTICGTIVEFQGPCFADNSKVTCIFHDLIVGPLQTNGYAKIVNGIPAAYCTVPFMQDTGRITVDLIIQAKSNSSAKFLHSTYLWVVTPPADVNAVFIDCETSEELLVSWTSSHPSVIGVETVDITLLNFDMTRRQWITLGTVATGVSNTGSTRANIARFQEIISNGLSIVSVRRSGTITDEDGSTICEGSISSSFIHRIASCEDPEFCRNWFTEDSGLPSSGDLMSPCPTLLSQAAVDSNFVQDESEKVKVLHHFHPNAAFYRSRFSGPSGIGQQCVYDRQSGRLIAGPDARGSSANRYNPDSFLTRTLHFIYDVVPFMACCYSSVEDCGLYYERRSLQSKPYVPPHACLIYGDPHIVTCDGLTYHFQGVGEFWLVKSHLPDGTTVLAQVRMEKWLRKSGVSVSTAIAFKDAQSSTVVIQTGTSNQLEVLADDRAIPINSDAMTTQNFRGFSIVERSSDLSVVTVALGSGIAFQVSLITVGTRHDRFISVTAFVSSKHRGALKGLFGNFDGKPEKDFISPDGTDVPVLPVKKSDGHFEAGANTNHIYWSFGTKWAISVEESLLSYPCGKSAFDYTDPTFSPNVGLVAAEAAPDECLQICQSASLSCLFDCVYIDANFANTTALTEVTFAHTVQLLLQNFVTCPALSSPDHGFLSGPYGGVASFGCDTGFSLIGSPTLTCVNGTWNQASPYCIKSATVLASCPVLSTPINGAITSTNLAFVHFSCNSGYEIVGPSMIHCQNGKWSSAPPRCKESTPPVNLKMKTTEDSGIDDKSVVIEEHRLKSSTTEDLMAAAINSGLDVNIDVNVNFKLPGGIKANKHRRTTRHLSLNRLISQDIDE